jgi:hypothetical protein
MKSSRIRNTADQDQETELDLILRLETHGLKQDQLNRKILM